MIVVYPRRRRRTIVSLEEARDGTRTSKRGDDRFCQDAIGSTNANAPALPLPSPCSASYARTSSNGGGRTYKKRDEKDSYDAPDEYLDATHAVGWTAPAAGFFLFTLCGIVLLLLDVVDAGVSSLPRLSPFNTLIMDEGGDRAGGRWTTMSAPLAPSQCYRRCAASVIKSDLGEKADTTQGDQDRDTSSW